MCCSRLLFMLLLAPVVLYAQHRLPSPELLPLVEDVPAQPLLAQAIRLKEALGFLGNDLPAATARRLDSLQAQAPGPHTVAAIQQLLDPYCLAMVDINPEARVKVSRGTAPARLMQEGWTSFLVKVHNQAGVRAQLKAESPNAAPAFHISTFNIQALPKHALTPGQLASRFLEIQVYGGRPLLPHLSGLALEYAVVQLYSKDAGQREAEIGFNIGQGSQDIGFRNSVPILFDILPAVKVVLRVKDVDGSPAMASFLITDGVERVLHDSVQVVNRPPADYRFTTAQMEYWESHRPAVGYQVPPRLTGIYPLPSRRVVLRDPYPDFFFQPQVYRADGETVLLPPGRYRVSFTRGPEYRLQTQELVVPAGVASMEATFSLQRWIHLAALGWYSADHHLHAAGCSHYESPEEGVKPADMWRQVLGEDLNLASVLSWGPGWYHQKQFFEGNNNPLSTPHNLMRYDVEVSGFPSSHCGHLVLLRLQEDDYPGTRQVADWPSWTGPVLQWAKKQGALTGYAHSGWGLQPLDEQTTRLPNFVLPKMDGIGANEYIVTLTQGLVDFFSAGDTPAPWELNMWYHTLNAGFRPRLSGESDFPCIYDERVGIARTYFKSQGPLNYEAYAAALKEGHSYVSEGNAHIINFRVDGLEAGTRNSELRLAKAGAVTITARVAALLPEVQDTEGARIARRPLDQQPYWHIERSRIGQGRKVRVELVVNGRSVDTTEVTADGSWADVRFRYPLTRSSWVALRVYPSAHTNPVFVLLNNQPIAFSESAAWCRQVVERCWHMKKDGISPGERPAAAAAYEAARNAYDRLAKMPRP